MVFYYYGHLACLNTAFVVYNYIPCHIPYLSQHLKTHIFFLHTLFKEGPVIVGLKNAAVVQQVKSVGL